MAVDLISSWTTPSHLFLLLNVVIGFIALISVFASRKNDSSPQPPEHHHHNYQIHRQDSAKTLLRAPSLFSRVTSFNFSSHAYGSEFAFDGAAEQENPSFLAPSLQISRSVEPEDSPVHGSSLQINRSVEAEINSSETTTDEPKPASIERAPSLLKRLTSFNRVSLNKSAEPETNPPQSERKLTRTPSLLSQMSSFDFSFYRSEASKPESAPAEECVPRMTRSTTESMKKEKRLPPTMKKSASEKSQKETETASFGADEVDAKADDFINRFKQQLRLQRLDSLLRYRNSAGGN